MNLFLEAKNDLRSICLQFQGEKPSLWNITCMEKPIQGIFFSCEADISIVNLPSSDTLYNNIFLTVNIKSLVYSALLIL